MGMNSGWSSVIDLIKPSAKIMPAPMMTKPMISEYTNPPALNSSRSKAMFKTIAINPMNSRFFSMSAISVLLGPNVGLITFPTSWAKKSTSTMPKTITSMPPKSLGK